MREGGQGGCSRRERLEVTAAALVPAALGLLAPSAALAGRLSWLAPVLALPVGLCLGPVWARLGERDLGGGLREAYGGGGGRLAVVLYLLWALVLLADAARRYTERLLTIYEGEEVRWLCLLAALGLCLWLGRGRGTAFARGGRCFFLAVGATLGIILLLALPGVEWKNLWPPEGRDWWGLPGAAALSLSLAGYGVYALCLTGQGGQEGRRSWAPLGCGALAALLLVVVGTFGPALASGLKDPFLYLLEGVRVPGAFRRGEAGLIALLALGDLVLLTLLSRGAVTLWREAVPLFPGLGWVPAAAALLLAGALPGMGRTWGWLPGILPRGNLFFGVLLPVLSVLTIEVRKARKRKAIFSGAKSEEKADVAVKGPGKKSGEENEKKC